MKEWTNGQAKAICPHFDVGDIKTLENVFVKHYAPNQMPDPKGKWSLLEMLMEIIQN